MTGNEQAAGAPRRTGLLSIILLSYYSGERLRTAHGQIATLMEGAGIPFELVIMDDGSKDDSYEIARSLETTHPNVSAYQLSRNYTSHYSIFAGLSVCRGACAAPIPDDEQQPYELLVQMYRQWQTGSQVVIPHRSIREDPPLSRFFSRMYYGLMNRLSEVKYPEGGADLFFIDREVIDILNQRIHPVRTASITEVLRLGFDPVYLCRLAGLLGLNRDRFALDVAQKDAAWRPTPSCRLPPFPSS
jgi:polyisoprenyl-phosphate glycosyltransferase